MIIYVGQECDYYTDEQEKKLPRYVHTITSPHRYMKGEKEIIRSLLIEGSNRHRFGVLRARMLAPRIL